MAKFILSKGDNFNLAPEEADFLIAVKQMQLKTDNKGQSELVKYVDKP